MFASAPSSTFTSMTPADIPVWQLDSKLHQDLHFTIWVCVIWDCCNCLWPGNTVKSSKYIDIINVILVNFNAVGVSSLWTTPWTWSGSGAPASAGSVTSLSAPVLHAGVLPLCQSELCPLLLEDLQHELKWFLKPHLWHFLPNTGQSLNWWVVLHLLHILLSLVLWLLILCELLVLIPFLPRLKTFDHIYCSQLSDPSIWFVVVEIFHHHFMFFCILE